MKQWRDLSDVRRDYGQLALSEADASSSPFIQFERWFNDILAVAVDDPTAMVLATVDEKGHPDTRVVLLKGFSDERLVFYTNYQSAKAMHIRHHPYVALNFYWPQMARQIRVRGRVSMVSQEESDSYFQSRPFKSQLSAMASRQSAVLESREALEERMNRLIAKYQDLVVRPEYWGGYAVSPEEFEFWQGRSDRLHDRIHYFQENGSWKHRRLAP